MNVLPIEMIGNILQYLSIDDILSCNLVCVAWRNELNRDRIWRNIYLNDFGLQVYNNEDYDEPPVVHPSFQAPPSKCKNLTEVCAWRIAYMMEKHIEKNMRKGQYKKEKIFDGALMTVNTFFWDGINLLVFCGRVDMLHVWEYKTYFAERPAILLGLLRTAVSCQLLCNQTYVVLQNRLLQIFKKTNGVFRLTYRFIAVPRAITHIPDSTRINVWYTTQIGRNMEVDTTFLLAYDKNCAAVAVHTKGLNCNLFVWDIEQGKRISFEELDLPDIKSIHMISSRLVIKFQESFSNGPITKLICFNVADLRVVHWKNSFGPSFVVEFTDNYVLALNTSVDRPLLHLHSIQAGCTVRSVTKLNYTKEFPYVGGYKLRIRGKYIIVQQPTMTGKKVEVYHRDDYKLRFIGGVYLKGDMFTCEFMRPNILIVSLRFSDSTPITILFDIKKKCKVRNFPYELCIVPNNRRKMLVLDSQRKTISSLTFW